MQESELIKKKTSSSSDIIENPERRKTQTIVPRSFLTQEDSKLSSSRNSASLSTIKIFQDQTLLGVKTLKAIPEEARDNNALFETHGLETEE